MTEENSICQICNGSGQISYFKGVSRFLLSEEECPACGGLGFIVDEEKKDRRETGPSAAPPIKGD